MDKFLPTLVPMAPTCASGHSPGETQPAEVLQSDAARQVLSPAGLAALFGPLSASYVTSVTAFGCKTHLRLSFVQEGFRTSVRRTKLFLPRVPGSLFSIPELKLAERWAQPPSLLMQREVVLGCGSHP